MQRDNMLTLNIWIQIKHNEFSIKPDGIRSLCRLFCWTKTSVSGLKDISAYFYEQSQTPTAYFAEGLQQWLSLATTEHKCPWPPLVHGRESPIVFKWASPLTGLSIFLEGAELLCGNHSFTPPFPREIKTSKHRMKGGRKAFSRWVTSCMT